MVILITYDLKAPGRDYTSLHEAIKKAGTWWHHLDSTWIVETSSSPQQWYQYLAPHLDANDFILVIEVTNNSYGFLPKRAWEWLTQRKYG